ncbi:hypothetical protein [Streptomyces sp. NPDC059863]|uniref:hypothetical protein n=1 Tax=unclassified Streptomyces TaxID=2593676 RepID=UPI00364B8F43
MTHSLSSGDGFGHLGSEANTPRPSNASGMRVAQGWCAQSCAESSQAPSHERVSHP